jgi:hypothetical protein
VVAVATGSRRVAIVGNHRWRWSAEQDWADGFRLNGWDVTEVDEREATGNEIVRIASRSDLLLWISSSDRHPQDVMRRCRTKTVTVAWHADLFFGLNRGNWRSSPMWAAEHVLTADGNPDNDWASLGVNRHEWLLPGVRDRWTSSPGRLREAFRCDVAFVGSAGGGYHRQWPYRSQLLERLSEMADRNGWTFLNPGGSSRRVERNQRMTDFYRSARVTVGDSLCLQQQGSRYWSDRVYEATGRGGVLIMPRIEELATQFPMMPMYNWSDWFGLEGTISRLLADARERDLVRAECQNVTRSGHTYSHRVRQLLEAVK